MKMLHIAYPTDDGIIAENTKFIFEQESGDIFCMWQNDLKMLKGKRLAGDGTFKARYTALVDCNFSSAIFQRCSIFCHFGRFLKGSILTYKMC